MKPQQFPPPLPFLPQLPLVQQMHARLLGMLPAAELKQVALATRGLLLHKLQPRAPLAQKEAHLGRCGRLRALQGSGGRGIGFREDGCCCCWWWWCDGVVCGVW